MIPIPVKNGIIPESIPIPESESCITDYNYIAQINIDVTQHCTYTYTGINGAGDSVWDFNLDSESVELMILGLYWDLRGFLMNGVSNLR